MNRTSVWILALSLTAALPTRSFADDGTPLRSAAVRYAAQQATSRPPMRRNSELFWGGIVLSAIGGGMLGWGMGSPTETLCTSSSLGTSCTQRGIGRAVWIGGGAAVAGAGILMIVLGGKRQLPSLTFGPSGVAVAHTLRFHR